jgi:hypothetical protein
MAATAYAGDGSGQREGIERLIFLGFGGLQSRSRERPGRGIFDLKIIVFKKLKIVFIIFKII